MQFIAESGVETPDTRMILLCRKTAEQVSKALEAAIVEKAIPSADLFDTDYRAVAGTDRSNCSPGLCRLPTASFRPYRSPYLPLARASPPVWRWTGTDTFRRTTRSIRNPKATTQSSGTRRIHAIAGS